MDDRQRDGLRRQLRALRMAMTDMELVHQAAEAIASGEHAELRYLLDTALVVTYARPFKGSEGDAQLGERMAPSGRDERRLHDLLIALRDELMRTTTTRLRANRCTSDTACTTRTGATYGTR